MRKLNLILFVGMLLVTLATGCQIIVPTAQILSQNLGVSQTVAAPPAVTTTETVTPTTPVTETAAVETDSTVMTETETIAAAEEPTVTTAMTDTVGMTDTGTMTDTPVMTETATVTTSETLTETPVLTETAAVTDSATLTDSAVITDSTVVTDSAPVTETEVATATTATATVLVDSLRIRTGPSTEAEVVGAAVLGERYPIIGQALDCQWFQVTHPVLGSVWIAGGEFAAADSDCAQIPAAAATDATALPAAPVDPAAPVATPVPAGETTTPTIQPTPTPATTADGFPADQGCLLLQNQLGPELTFTFTNTDGSFNETVQVTSEEDVSFCVVPGRYRVTVDAPPPWADLNEEFTLNAGDRFFFPIRPR